MKLLVYMSAEDLARLGGLIYAGRSVLIEGFLESGLLLQLSAFTHRAPLIVGEEIVHDERDVLTIYPNVTSDFLSRLVGLEGWVATTRKLEFQPSVPTFRMATKELVNAPPPLPFFVDFMRMASKTSTPETVIRGLAEVVRSKAEAVRLMLEADVDAGEAFRAVHPTGKELPVILLTLKLHHGITVSKEAVKGVLNA